MKLTVLQRHDDPGFSPISAIFHAPGGTLGRSADNHLTLPDAERAICRVQAAVRISGDACYLVNLSGMSQVSINGRAVSRDQEVPLSPGDELAIGPYRLRADDPAAPAEAIAAVGAAAAAAAPTDVLAEPDPLLESPLLDDVDLTPPATRPAPPEAPPAAIAAAAPQAPVADTAGLPPVDIPAAHLPAADLPPLELRPEHYDAPRARDAAYDDLDTAAAPAQASGGAADRQPPAPRLPDLPSLDLESDDDAPPATSRAAARPPVQPAAPGPLDAPFGDMEPLAAEPATPQSDPSDVFSDLFGPGTLPVGSVPDVSAHPFDLDSAQSRNPEDPLRQLPRGDANVAGPLRDPLDALASPDSDDAHNVFSDQTPSTLPAHDPLAPHRSDPVSDTLNRPRDEAGDGRAARDHLREYGGYLRPARVKPSDEPERPAQPPRRK
ncbi:FHA domain-containing protein [Bordetella petrii]|uniref:FHA domain-containing protein n=1 Tax=Bordetella petrii TaxID=94624 RepID=A0ABT7W2U6_9BORD|nr:FHA domain-containing protein [Bordetella petrii]MDM9559501.1 FHA domain-containing protein [Bordetella petrii]